MGWKCDWQDVGAGNELCESSLLFVRVVAYMIIVHENEPRLIHFFLFFFFDLRRRRIKAFSDHILDPGLCRAVP